MHVAIIMDGNGRWAQRRGLGRSFGHRAGAKSVEKVVEAAARSQVEVLTLYAFSSDNWKRPPDEVAALMSLLRRYLRSELKRCLTNGIRVNVIGRRDRLDAELVTMIERAEKLTSGGQRLLLRLAVDYSARYAISRAAELAREDGRSSGGFDEHLARASHACVPVAPVDLLIRTGGERRLSDFLLWECAYAELLFVEKCWPDFSAADFDTALQEFSRIERRFGGVSAEPLRAHPHAVPGGLAAAGTVLAARG
jgi:undecaprenyl diphosphate synthase